MNNPFFEKPILNSPYEYPSRHWELDNTGQPTQKIIQSRRSAAFITPIPKPRKRKGQATQPSLVANNLSTQDQKYDHTALINAVRREVDKWRRIPILHIKAQNAYSISDIQEQLQNRFEFLINKVEPESLPPVKNSNDPKIIQPTSDDSETNGTCTDCGAPLVKRQAKKGKFAGNYFLACSNFPKCRKIVPLKRAAI